MAVPQLMAPRRARAPTRAAGPARSGSLPRVTRISIGSCDRVYQICGPVPRPHCAIPRCPWSPTPAVSAGGEYVAGEEGTAGVGHWAHRPAGVGRQRQVGCRHGGGSTPSDGTSPPDEFPNVHLDRGYDSRKSRDLTEVSPRHIHGTIEYRGPPTHRHRAQHLYSSLRARSLRNLRCSLRAIGGRPGDRIGGLRVATAPPTWLSAHNSPLG